MGVHVVVTQFNSVFCILHENGQEVNWQFTKTEAFNEVSHLPEEASGLREFKVYLYR